MHRAAAWVVAVTWLGWQAPGVLGQPAAAKAQIKVDKQKLPLSGQLAVTITVEGPGPLQVETITSLTSSKQWEVVQTYKPTMTLLNGSRMRWRQVFTVEPLLPGELSLPINPIRYRSGTRTDGWTEQPWKPIPVEVSTEVAEPTLEHVRGNSVIERLEDKPETGIWPIAIGIAFAAVAILAFTAWRWHRRQAPAPQAMTPDQWALHELDRIDQLGLPGRGEVEPFHRHVANVLRSYLDKRLGLPASQQTTAEFLHTLQTSSQLPESSQTILRDFLHQCDLAKFARAAYSPAECEKVSRLARDFIKAPVHREAANQ